MARGEGNPGSILETGAFRAQVHVSHSRSRFQVPACVSTERALRSLDIARAY